MAKTINETLEERGSRYGSFHNNAQLAQDLKNRMRESTNWDELDADMAECLDFVASKIVRILEGDPWYRDSWHDCVGYFKLVDERLKEEGC